MHIACVIAGMKPGGAERVMATLATHWAGQGHRVTLITFAAPDEDPFYALHPAIDQRRLGENGTRDGVHRALRVGRRVAAIRRELQTTRPDCVLSFVDLTNVMTLLAARGLGIPVVVSERTDPFHYALGSVERWLRARTYPMADRIIVQTSRAAGYFGNLNDEKLVVLPNPIFPAHFAATPDKPGKSGRYRIIGVGRLDRPKGHHLLLTAFSAIAAAFPAWDVDIYGEGPRHAELEAMIASKGLGGRVRLMRPTKAIGLELSLSSILAFPSAYEGFPNALGEAMAAGLPAVAFHNVNGVEDLVQDGTTGLLAAFGESDWTAAQSLSHCLAKLMRDPDLRNRMGEAARVRSRTYRPEIVLARWDAVLEAAVAGQPVPDFRERAGGTMVAQVAPQTAQH